GGARPGPEVVRSDLDPRALLVRRYAGFSHNLSWAQIGSMLGTPGLDAGLRERLDRVRFGRISAGVTVVLALVVSMPFFLAREPKNMLAQSLKCAPVAIGALVGGVIGAAWPVPGVPAAVAVFLPVLVLLPVAIAMVSLVRT
ncbi:MAG TPA: hypothetical protein VD963_04460, partial [Phycisphaerales bacterium]|nr:hypothetical protein [Phycisphaerales bacterium]